MASFRVGEPNDEEAGERARQCLREYEKLPYFGSDTDINMDWCITKLYAERACGSAFFCRMHEDSKDRELLGPTKHIYPDEATCLDYRQPSSHVTAILKPHRFEMPEGDLVTEEEEESITKEELEALRAEEALIRQLMSQE